MAAATWAAAIANVLVAIVAAFQETIKRAIHHPDVELQLISARPDCQRIDIVTAGGPTAAYYLRLRARNKGNVTAEHVEVFVAELHEFRDNDFKLSPWFLPMALMWTHTCQAFADSSRPTRTCNASLAESLNRSCAQGFRKTTSRRRRGDACSDF